MIDVPETCYQRERGRVLALVDVHGPGAPGVTLPAADMVALTESILERAR